MSQTTQKPNIPKVVGNVPFDHGFHFYTENGVYTGITATSLTEFASKLKTIDINSVLFHYHRGDFQKWIDDTLVDKELADQMCFVKTQISEEELRNQLLKIIQKRTNELKKAMAQT